MDLNQQNKDKVNWRKPIAGQLKINNDEGWSRHTKELALATLWEIIKERLLLPLPLIIPILPHYLWKYWQLKVQWAHSLEGRGEEEIIIEENSLEAIQITGKDVYVLLQEIKFLQARKTYIYTHINREANKHA